MLSDENLFCSICQEVFKDPVLLSCSHSFCRDCLRSWWREKHTQVCPVCKRKSSRSDPPRNLALRNLCEDYVQQIQQKVSEEQVCQVHSERLKLFCLTDQQPVCVVCRDSKVHENHRFRPTVEAAQDLREELDKSLLPLKKSLQKAMNLKDVLKVTVDCIKEQAHCTEKQIEIQFLELHNFLSEQQESQIKALKEEEEQKTQRMKNQIAVVSGEIEILSESIRATEEQLSAPDVSFLFKYKAAVERVQRCPLLEEEPQLSPGDLIDQAKHLGNLTFNIWTNMKKLVHYTPVILDPNTVRNAVLSNDLTSFNYNFKETDQESREEHAGLAYGSEGFDSGSHSWDVEVGENEKWMLGVGVAPEYGFKKGKPEKWCIVFSGGKYGSVHNKDFIFLKLVSNPVKIRVHLNSYKHEVSFYDLDTNAHIHTFTQISQKKLHPAFLTLSKSPIKILPQLERGNRKQ